MSNMDFGTVNFDDLFDFSPDPPQNQDRSEVNPESQRNGYHQDQFQGTRIL